MSFKEIEKDIKSGAIDKAAPVLLCGEEAFLVDYYEQQLLALFSGGQESPLDLSIFYGDETDDQDIMAALDTFPMLLPSRLVVVKNHSAFSGDNRRGGNLPPADKAKHELAEYIASIPETSRLIFTADKANKTRTLYKAIKKVGTVYEFTHLNEADLRNFVLKRFKTYGTNITTDVLDAFIFATGYLEKDSDRDLFTVENDAYKLAYFVLGEGRTTITQNDIQDSLPDVLRTDVFAMLDAISSGKKAKSITLLENSLADGENVFRLLSLFTGHFEIMLGYKELSAEGRSAKEIARMLGDKNEWRVKKLGGFAQRFDIATLRRILQNLYETERNIKSGDITQDLALTVLLTQI